MDEFNDFTDDLDNLYSVQSNIQTTNIIERGNQGNLLEDISLLDDVSLVQDSSVLDSGITLDDIESVLSIDNNTIDYDSEYGDDDFGDFKHLELSEVNDNPDNDFKTYVQSNLKYPCVVIKKDTFVNAQFVNMFKLLEEGSTPLVVECKGNAEEIYKITLNSKNIITLKRIFKLNILYRENAYNERIIEPLDLIGSDELQIEME